MHAQRARKRSADDRRLRSLQNFCQLAVNGHKRNSSRFDFRPFHSRNARLFQACAELRQLFFKARRKHDRFIRLYRKFKHFQKRLPFFFVKRKESRIDAEILGRFHFGTGLCPREKFPVTTDNRFRRNGIIPCRHKTRQVRTRLHAHKTDRTEFMRIDATVKTSRNQSDRRTDRMLPHRREISRPKFIFGKDKHHRLYRIHKIPNRALRIERRYRNENAFFRGKRLQISADFCLLRCNQNGREIRKLCP